MKEHPILFSGPMVRAILEGRKTMTRRPVKPQPVSKTDLINTLHFVMNSVWKGTVLTGKRDWFLAQCPYGQPGDRLWVRETFVVESNWGMCEEYNPPFEDGRPIKLHTDDESRYWSQAHYAATDPLPELVNEDCTFEKCSDNGMCQHWKPSIHMPRWASRILLEVTSVRVERIQEITDADAILEGIVAEYVNKSGPAMYDGNPPKFQFMRNWNAIYPGSWDRNDWVLVLEFKRV